MLGCALFACGGSSSPSPAGEPVTPIVVATPPLAADDVEVARVNGHAVWASCVTTQAAQLARAARPAPAEPALRRQALDQCVAFELLAEAAEARGLAADPDVADAARAAAVNRLVETDFEQRYRTVADLGPAVQPIIKRNEWRLHLIQLRASTYARFEVPVKSPPEVDAKAKALAEQLANRLAGQHGLFAIHLTEAAQQLAAGTGIQLNTANVKPTYQGDLVDTYAAALYAIPEVGMTSQAVRTQWGWDVVLWTGGVEAKDSTRAELEAEMFPELRRRQFQLWATQIAKQLGVHVDVDHDNVAKLDQETTAGAALSGELSP
jgi:hypothetical protein